MSVGKLKIRCRLWCGVHMVRVPVDLVGESLVVAIVL